MILGLVYFFFSFFFSWFLICAAFDKLATPSKNWHQQTHERISICFSVSILRNRRIMRLKWNRRDYIDRSQCNWYLPRSRAILIYFRLAFLFRYLYRNKQPKVKVNTCDTIAEWRVVLFRREYRPALEMRANESPFHSEAKHKKAVYGPVALFGRGGICKRMEKGSNISLGLNCRASSVDISYRR